MTTELVVEAQGLGKRYGSIVAVDGVDMRVARGEVYGFLGPNGAGKTTTLRMLAGLIRPTSGTATVAGGAPGTPESLSRIGCLIEAPAFYPYLSGTDNLRVVADYSGVPRSAIEPALQTVELAPRAGDKFKTYSLGMKQRLGVAAALLKNPDLLILDEPTNGLDPQGMADMRGLITHLGQGSRTVLVSSHLLAEVEHMCTRIGVIQRGKVIAEGTVDELRRGPSTLQVRAEPAEKALDVLVREVGVEQVFQENGFLQVRVEPSRAAALNRALVQDGVEVSHLAMATRSLEDAFLELTGGETGL
ncbi:MAG: ABC transporter ATP-binding protein [Candidatus Dormibacteraeota bacterium]|nr:ABC transporter ATP-binding protein [Candidatus Dormibacteraeota bacterium]MBO0703912.1 ABC transporter ATP-binding protein [Candidatus Dormibacteraeota bacterium]MBO0759974.1 ABC transporter ATP-binding protein [Candidatus Dormibacteraeota bacterium]